MKKLSFLLLIAGFSLVVSAQQNDFFDAEKYLQKKSKESKRVDKPIFPKPTLQNLFSGFQSVNPQTKLSHTLSNGDKVYLLSQDNMPCIVPDMTTFNRSNISRINKYPDIFIRPHNLPGNIPNVVIPKKIIITK